MHAIAESALKTVGVEQAQEDLEILFFAVMRRGGEQDEVTRDLAKQFTKLVAFSILDLAAKEGGRHLVRLVYDDQIPLGLLQFGLDVFIAGQFIQSGDSQRGFGKGIARNGSLQAVVRENVKGNVKAQVELILPLLHKVAGRDDEAAMEIATNHEFFDEQSCHDGFARSWVVGQQVAQGLFAQHRLV